MSRKSKGLERLVNRARAHRAVRKAVYYGILPKVHTQKCRVCNNRAVNYHHYLGYEEPHWLDVIPLCIRCHSKAHADDL
jgi:hypothetical protein